MAYDHTDTDVKNQLSNNMETTQKPRKQDNPKYSSALSQRKQQSKANYNNYKKRSVHQNPGNLKNSSGFQHEKGDSKKWTETNLY